MPDLADLKKLTFRYLGLRPRSVHEVTTYLQGKSATSLQVKELIEYFQSLHLLDDQEFVNWYCASRLRRRPVSRLVLKQELANYGISMDSFTLPTSDLTAAQSALEKALPKYSHYPEPQRRQKLIDFLRRRGFAWSVIEPALKNRYNS